MIFSWTRVGRKAGSRTWKYGVCDGIKDKLNLFTTLIIKNHIAHQKLID